MSDNREEKRDGYIAIVTSIARLETEVKNMTKVMDKNGFAKKIDLDNHVKADRWMFGVLFTLFVAVLTGVIWHG